MKKLMIFILLLVFTLEQDNANPQPNLCHTTGGRFSFASLYAQCANVLTEKKDQIEQWTYRYCNESQDKDKVSNITLFTDKKMDLLAFVAYDIQRQAIILSFRATTLCGENHMNILTDLTYEQKLYRNQKYGGGCTQDRKCRVHKGFLQTYEKFTELNISGRIMEIRNYYADKSMELVVTGISYGGAIAAIAAYDLNIFFKSKNFRNLFIVCLTYGAPRVGNLAFKEEVDKTIEIQRYVNQGDPIPHMPSRCGDSIHPYYHPGRQVYMQSLNNSRPQLKICKGDGVGCSLNKYGSNYDICKHLQYHKINYFNDQSCLSIPSGDSPSHIPLKDCTQQFKSVMDWIVNSIKHHPPCPSINDKNSACPTNVTKSMQFLRDRIIQIGISEFSQKKLAELRENEQEEGNEEEDKEKHEKEEL